MPYSASVRSSQLQRIVAAVFVLTVLLVLPSCWVFSVNPLFDGASDPDLVFDQNLVGSWTLVKEDCEWILTMEASARAYAVKLTPGVVCKDQKASRIYWGYLVKLDNHRFLDLTPGPGQFEACDLCLPVHSFALISQENNNLVMTPLDDDWLFQSIKNKKVVLAHLGVDDDADIDMTLTARPAELKDFLRKYVNDKDAFKARTTLIFTRK